MNAQRAVRWSGGGICNGRLRLARGLSNGRYYSLQNHRPGLPYSEGLRIGRDTAHRVVLHQQARSISLFGWGSSSKSDQFSTSHPSLTADAVTQSTQSNVPSIEQVRSVKASHATSDAPDPASLSTAIPSTPEPTILQQLESVVVNPGGHAPEVSNAADQIEEYSGYLKEVCGLDYGWGPTSMMGNIYESIHLTTGLSWATSIIVLAVLYRAVVFLPVYRGADQGAKMREIMPIITPLREEMMKATAAKDMAKRQQIAAEMQAINKEIGFSPMKLFWPILIQIPLGFGGFRFLRGCAEAPVPAFTTESWLWNVDLTASDPYYAIPILQGALLYFSIRMSQKSGLQTLEGGMGRFLLIGMPAISVLWSSFQPGSVQLFFLISTSLASLQGFLLQNAAVRKAIGLLPMPETRKPTDAPNNLGGMSRFSRPAPGGKVIDVQAKPSRPEPPGSTSNRSFVDRVIEGAAKKTKNLAPSVFDKTSAEYTAKMEEKRQEAEKQQFEKYEYKRRQELAQEREGKNYASQLQRQHQQQSPSSTPSNSTIGPGGMRILKKDDATKRRKR